MKRFPLSIAVPVFMALSFGCANRASQANNVDLADKAVPSTDQPAKLSELVGKWSGTYRLWFMPGDPVRESQSDAAVALAASDSLALISYAWAFEGDPQEGILMVRTNSDQDDVEVVWVDSWHTGNEFMLFHNEENRASLVAVHGTYPAPPGPDWGWRIQLESKGADEFHILMYNIPPDGQEILAVDSRYTRAQAKLPNPGPR